MGGPGVGGSAPGRWVLSHSPLPSVCQNGTLRCSSEGCQGECGPPRHPRAPHPQWHLPSPFPLLGDPPHPPPAALPAACPTPVGAAPSPSPQPGGSQEVRVPPGLLPLSPWSEWTPCGPCLPLPTLGPGPLTQLLAQPGRWQPVEGTPAGVSALAAVQHRYRTCLDPQTGLPWAGSGAACSAELRQERLCPDPQVCQGTGGAGGCWGCCAVPVVSLRGR